jgi:hypothetical protein
MSIKNNFLFFFFLSLLLCTSSHADWTIGPKQPEPIGPVKSISTFDENKILRHETTYNEQGKITKKLYYEPDGSLYEKESYDYDDDGNKTKYTYYKVSFGTQNFSYDKKGNLIELDEDLDPFYKSDIARYIYKYNESGSLIEEVSYTKQGKIFEKTIYSYKNGKLVKKLYRRPDKKTPAKTIYSYNSKGNNTKITFYWYNGSLSGIWIYDYDNMGNKTKWEKQHYYSGTYRGKSIYLYDKRGNNIQRTDLDEKGSLMEKRLYEYNDSNNILSEKVYDENGVLRMLYKYSYDIRGNLKESGEYFKGKIGSSDKYTYEYDTVGNWVKRTLNESDVWTQAITYWTKE